MQMEDPEEGYVPPYQSEANFGAGREDKELVDNLVNEASYSGKKLSTNNEVPGRLSKQI